MTLLTRITVVYSETEDRIRLSGLNENQEVLTFWLTRRLADRLFVLLLNWLDSRNAGQGGADMLQSFEQQAALSTLAPAAPVPAQGTPPEAGRLSDNLLIENVDVTKGDSGVILAFKDASGQEAKLALTLTELRQWLAICCKTYQAADWPMTIWPRWMLPEPEAGGRSAITRIH